MTAVAWQIAEAVIAALLLVVSIVGGIYLTGMFMTFGGLWLIAAGCTLAATPVGVGATLWAIRER